MTDTAHNKTTCTSEVSAELWNITICASPLFKFCWHR